MWLCFRRIAFPAAAAQGSNSAVAELMQLVEADCREFGDMIKRALDRMEHMFWPQVKDAEDALRWALEYSASSADPADDKVAIVVKYSVPPPSGTRAPQASVQDVKTEYKTIRFDTATKCSRWLKYHFLATTFARIESSVMTVLEPHSQSVKASIANPAELLKLQPLILYNLRANVAWVVSDALAEAD